MKLIAALSKVFKLPSQTLLEFHKEVKDLTPQDKEDFVRWFNGPHKPEVITEQVTLQ